MINPVCVIEKRARTSARDRLMGQATLHIHDSASYFPSPSVRLPISYANGLFYNFRLICSHRNLPLKEKVFFI